jgi:hypothetical protein
MKIGDLIQFKERSVAAGTRVQKQGVVLEIQHRLWRPDGAKLLSCEVLWCHPNAGITWVQERRLEVINES